MAYNPTLVPTVATIAALRTLPAAQYSGVFVEGYHSPSDGGGGLFMATNSTVADNGITTIASAAGGGFLRDISQQTPTPAMAGAYADFASITASITVIGTALTVPGGTFSSADIGKNIYIPGAGAAGAIFQTTIAAASGTSVTLSASAPTSLSGSSQAIDWGHDDTAALNNYFALVATLQLIGRDTPGKSNFYLVTNLIYGQNRADGSESGAGWGFEGNDLGTQFIAAPNATGVIFAAKSVAQNNFSRFAVNRNGARAIAIDTSWPNNPFDSQGNYYWRVRAGGNGARTTFTGTVTSGSNVITGLSINPVSLGFARGFVLLVDPAFVQAASYIDTFTATTITMSALAVGSGTVTIKATPPAWFAENNNDTTFDNSTANGGGFGDTQDIGFLINASGGSVWMYGCTWFSALTYIAAQNFLFSACEGAGIAYVPYTGTYQSGLLLQCQMFNNQIYRCLLMLGGAGAQTLKIVGGIYAAGGTGNAMMGQVSSAGFPPVSAEEVIWLGQTGCTMLSTATPTLVTGSAAFPSSVEHRKCSFYSMTLNDAVSVVNQFNGSESSFNGGAAGQPITTTPATIAPKFCIASVYHVHGFAVGGAQYSAIIHAVASPAAVNVVNEIPVPGVNITYSVAAVTGGAFLSAVATVTTLTIQVDRISGI